MAQQVNVLFIDDIDGSEAEGTVRFGLDGEHYEIDLSRANSAKLHAVLAPYIETARPVRPVRTSKNASRRVRSDRKDKAAQYEPIRRWAKQQGYEISDRGRIPSKIIAQYNASQAGVTTTTAPDALRKPPPVVAEPDGEEPTPASTVKPSSRKARGGRAAASPKASAAKA